MTRSRCGALVALAHALLSGCTFRSYVVPGSGLPAEPIVGRSVILDLGTRTKETSVQSVRSGRLLQTRRADTETAKRLEDLAWRDPGALFEVRTNSLDPTPGLVVLGLMTLAVGAGLVYEQKECGGPCDGGPGWIVIVGPALPISAAVGLYLMARHHEPEPASAIRLQKPTSTPVATP